MTQFKFTFQPGMSVKQIIGFEAAGRVWSQFLGDDITVNVHVAMTQDLPQSVIGGAIPVYVDTRVGAVQNALTQDATSSEDAIAASNLQVRIGDSGVLEYSGVVGDSVQSSSDMAMTQANAKALGLATPRAGLDGYVVLNSLENSRYSWNYDLGRTASASSQSLDFLSVALHELGHILGFTSGADVINDTLDRLNRGTLLDLYRYSNRSLASGAQELTTGASAYFSIDGGKTAIAPFSAGIVPVLGGVEGYQASHWANNSLGGSINRNLTDSTANNEELATDFLTDLFAIAAPASDQDQADDITQLLAVPGGQSILANGSANATLDESGAGGLNLGIMDPTLAPGERSNISGLDLLAMDVLGYDMTGARTAFDYGALLAESEGAIAQTLGMSVGGLRAQFNASVDTGALTQDRWQDVLSAINESPEIYERRRKRRRTPKNSRASFWQEEGLDPTVINIISDGAGDSADIIADANSPWVTVVEALSYAPLILRTVNLVGNDANDLMITAFDQYQTITAGNGDNVVQLGKEGGVVTAGSGHDTIMSMGGRNTIDAGDGDNVIVLDDQQSGQRTVTTGKGHDYVNVTGSLATVDSGAGNDVVVLNRTDTTFDQGEFTVTASAGDNTIQLNGGMYTTQTVTTGDGHDTIEVRGDSGTITSGAGDDVIIAKPGANGVNDAFRISAMGGDNTVLVDGGTFGTQAITTGQGNDLIQFTALSATVTAGDGNDIILGKNISNGSFYYDQPTYTVDAAGGNNLIQLKGNRYQQIDVTTGAGNDVVSFTGNGATVETGAGDDLISGTKTTSFFSTYQVDAGEGNNRIQLWGNGSEEFLIASGAGDDVVELTGLYGRIDAGDGRNVVRTEGGRRGAFDIRSGAGDDTIIAGAGNDSIRTGNGNDIINGTDSKNAGRYETDTITTGDGRDIVILGDRQRAYYTGNRNGDYARIEDFSEQDRLQLHGNAADYWLTRTQLFYKGDAIATFSRGVNFTLESDQVYFVNDASVASFELPSIPIPTLELPDLADIDVSREAIEAYRAQINDTVSRFPADRFPSNSVSADSVLPDLTLPAINVPEVNVPEINVPTVNEILDLVQTTLTTGEAPVYSIVGGADAQFFSIDPNTGDLWWTTTPEFASMDANGDNKYDVIVQATLGDGNAKRDVDTQELTIIVPPDTVSTLPPINSQPVTSPVSSPVAIDIVEPIMVVDRESSIMELGAIATPSLTGQDGVANQSDLSALTEEIQPSAAASTDSAIQQNPEWLDSLKASLDTLVLTGSSDPQTDQSQVDALQSSIQNLMAAFGNLQNLNLSGITGEGI